VLLIYESGSLIIREPGIIDLDTKIHDPQNVKYFAGHVQAPTSVEQKFQVSTSHPFCQYPWVVAHNGILTNFDKLKKGVPGWAYNNVDSSIIPALLNDYSTEDSEDKMIAVLSSLEGTHATWIYNSIEKELYIARCGSTLFGKEETAFSSVPFEDFFEIREGILYQTYQNYKEIRFYYGLKFKANSPFLTI